jgi:metallophosphoesterase (TIGR00282 family)
VLKILFIGDIVGRIGRKAVAKILPELKKKEKIDLVIANAENSAHGTGVTEKTVKELQQAGVDWMTSGDHAFDQTKQLAVYGLEPILRPANWADKVPGQGYALIETKKGKVLLVNLIGRVFMSKNFACPFAKLEEILANFNLLSKKISAIIIDIHAEATSEKISLLHFADGQVSAILGTHTHIMTADARITAQGTAYITDVGMVGAAEECLGIAKEGVIKTFLTQIKQPHVIPKKGPAIFNAMLLTINPRTGQASKIKPVIRTVNYN